MAADTKITPRRRWIVALSVLNVALLVNLWGVYVAIGNFAAGIVWWSGVLLIVALVSGAFTTVIAARRGRLVLAALNFVCVVPYVVLLMACMVPSGPPETVQRVTVHFSPATEGGPSGP